MNPNDESDVHITYRIEAQKVVEDEHHDGGEIFVHSKSDMDAIVKAFRALGFQVNVQRRSESFLIDDIEPCHD